MTTAEICDLIDYQLCLGDLTDDQLDTVLFEIENWCSWLRMILQADGRDALADEIAENSRLTMAGQEALFPGVGA